MTFLARYDSATESYWRTVVADSLKEATHQAKRYARKGFRFAFLTSV